jgi:hypothetical protein
MDEAMDVDPLVELPLQVKDDGIYWQNKPSGPSEESQHQTVVGDEKCIWRRRHVFLTDKEESTFWQALVEERMLLDRGGGKFPTTKINEERLVRLVTDCGGYEDGARFVAAISNARRMKLHGHELLPEMAYQQLVFPPISGLFYSFDPGRYAADSMVYTSVFTYKDGQGVSVRGEGFRPSAAVKFSKQHLVMATLELEAAGGNQDDIQKSVLMCLISALALISDTDLSTVTIPFVVNVDQIAYLFTAKVIKGKVPVIKKIFGANMCDQGNTAMIVAYLAVIVHKLKQDIQRSSKASTLQLDLDCIAAPSRLFQVEDNSQ